MKQLLLLFMAALFITVASAVKPYHEVPLNASRVMITIGQDKSISLMELATISRTNYEQLSGKKLNLLQRVSFKLAQNKLRHDINSNGELTGKKYQKAFAADPGMDGTSGFHLGGAALGFFLGIIGVLIAYVAFKDNKKSNRIRWAWIGFVAALILGLGIIFLL